MWKHFVNSWSPSTYGQLRELSLPKVFGIVLITAFLCALLFVLLLLPAFLSIDESLSAAAQTTTITFNATMTQTEPAYLTRNPDVVLTTSSADAFIVITPEYVSVKRFIFFGAKQYSWDTLTSFDRIPAAQLIPPLILFLLPSLVFWSAAWLLGAFFVWGFLYTLLAHFAVHARSMRISYTELCKVSAYAAIPSIQLFAVAPIIRLGLPLALVVGFLFVLWLVLALLGTTMLVEHHRRKP
jgi:hypothetical protein